jgi:lipoprotein-anchoring transpeptidase ErfK/SrfK
MQVRYALVAPLIVAGLFYGQGALAAHPQDVPVRPEHRRTAEVSVWKADFTDRARFQTFPAAHIRGGFLASGDVTGDGAPEIVIGAGTGAPAEVRVYSADGGLLKIFYPYTRTFKGGVRVAVGDLDGDGKAEIVTSPGPGMEPLVRRFAGDGSFAAPNGVLAYAEGFRGGVRVAVGDLDGDGKAEIVTAPGPGGGPHVRVFDGALRPLDQDFFAFDASMRDGIVPAILRTPEGSLIAISVESWSAPLIKLFKKSTFDGYAPYYEFLAFDGEWRSGVSIAAFDHDGDGFDEIAAHGNGGTNAELRVLSRHGDVLGKYLVQDPHYRGGLSVVQVRVASGPARLATAALIPLVSGPLTQEKAIHVNLAEQRVYAYERGRIARTFLISTGTPKYPTPAMNTWVRSKVPVKRYRWSYGPGHPDNYDLPNVKWNLQIFGPYFIHGAYWHNNFGHRMSHGCINMRTSEAEWIYNWAEVGTQVRTFYAHPPQDEFVDPKTSEVSYYLSTDRA